MMNCIAIWRGLDRTCNLFGWRPCWYKGDIAYSTSCVFKYKKNGVSNSGTVGALCQAHQRVYGVFYRTFSIQGYIIWPNLQLAQQTKDCERGTDKWIVGKFWE